MAVGTILKTIKPDDLVRTSSGRTCICIELRHHGFRLVEDTATGERSIVHAAELYLVKSAPVRRWPEHTLTDSTRCITDLYLGGSDPGPPPKHGRKF